MSRSETLDLKFIIANRQAETILFNRVKEENKYTVLPAKSVLPVARGEYSGWY